MITGANHAGELPALRHRYYAGNQNEFRSTRLSGYGCGLVAFTDLLLYLMERDWRREGERGVGQRQGRQYEALVERLDRSMARVYRGIGLNGFSMAHAFNRRAKARDWKLRARWGVPRRFLLSAIQDMLSRDIPVILSVGPGFRGTGGAKGVTLYRNGKRTEIRARDHYVTVIGMETDGNSESKYKSAIWKEEEKGSGTPAVLLRVVSWGKEYRISAEEYLRGASGGLPVLRNLFSNVLYVS